MRGKILFVTGLAAGYVLGTRAGRARYEQIKSGWLSVWNAAPVQNQVEKVETFAKARISEVPGFLLVGVRKIASAIAPSEPETEPAAPTPKSAAAAETKKASAAKPAAKKPSAKKPAAKKPAAAQKSADDE